MPDTLVRKRISQTLIEPPSQELIHRLTSLKLCTAADLRRCRRRVRKLARGIPAFDSVWIDALVQAQKISPFQAKALEAGHPEQLTVGPYLLISELGHSHKSRTFIARPSESADRCALKLTQPQSEYGNQLQQDFHTLLQQLQGLHHPSLILPRVVKPVGQQFVVISHYLPSSTVSELLIRRGRFPVPVVLSLGAQLLDALVALEKRRVIHGDIRPWNVRLTPSGIAALVDTGLEPILSPELTIHSSLPPRCYDGIAPELIGTGRHPNAQSDLYALGCLLWELLAGRPPFTTGDPLAKLACHQTKTIPDIRSWAPETPAPLAEMLLKLTASQPNQRPTSMQAAQQQWPVSQQGSRKTLARFHASFQHQTPRSQSETGTSRPGRLPLIAAMIFVLSGLSYTLLDEGARNHLLEITSRVSFTQSSTNSSPAETTTESSSNQKAETAAQRQLLPVPDGNGVILLDSAEPYVSTQISTVGGLSIKGTAENPAIIEIEETPCRIVAASLSLENVIFVNRSQSPSPQKQSASAGTSTALLHVTAQSLKIKGCCFTQLDSERSDTSALEREAIYWSPLDPQQRNSSQVHIQDTLFAVPQHALHLTHAPQVLTLTNSLNVTSHSTLYLERAPEIDQQFNLKLQHLTLREAGPLVLLNWTDPTLIPGTIQIEARDCVFDLNQAALIQVRGQKPPENWLSSVSLLGEGSVASAEIQIAGWQASATEPLQELSTLNMDIEGLSTGKFEYAAPLSLHAEDSVITAAQVPRTSSLPPGIQVKLFPAFLARLMSLEN